MASWRGGYHLHLTYDTSRPESIRWSVTRSWWALGKNGQSAVLATGRSDVIVGQASVHEVALALLRVGTEAYAAQLAEVDAYDHP